VFHKELMMTPMDHLHRFQEMLRISEERSHWICSQR
jgi:hypothetical protein